jgi:hypothetical protein
MAHCVVWAPFRAVTTSSLRSYWNSVSVDSFVWSTWWQAYGAWASLGNRPGVTRQ